MQSNQVVLVGVEPHSTYIYLCEGTKSRDSTAWAYAFLDKQEQGLNIELSLNDGGTGLIKGVQEVYPNAKIQSDIFHPEKRFLTICTVLKELPIKQLLWNIV